MDLVLKMIIDSQELWPQVGPIVQKLMDDVLSISDGRRPLKFTDEDGYRELTGKSIKLAEGEAFFNSNNKCFIICLKPFMPINAERELSIAHELGHMWLRLKDYPQEGAINDPYKQEAYDKCCGPIFDIMQHAIIYPWLKETYGIDLYERGKNRLISYIGELPKKEAKTEANEFEHKLYYIKHNIESADVYWLGKLSNKYSKPKLSGCKQIAENVLSVIRQLGHCPLDADSFLKKYQEVLRVLNIKEDAWPSICQKQLWIE